MVEQLGLAMMAGFRIEADVAGINLRDHQGDLRSIRQALELSTTTAPARAAMGPNSLLMPPRRKQGDLHPVEGVGVQHLHRYLFAQEVTFFPRDRSEASAPSGPPESSSPPNKPPSAAHRAVAPTTATLYVPPMIANLLGR